MSEEILKSSRLMTLESIVYNVLNDIGDYNERNFKRYMQWAIRGLKKLNLHVLKGIETDSFEIDDKNMVYLPDDMVDWIRIGVVYDGQLWTLTENPDIPFPRGESCGEVDVDSSNTDAESMPDVVTWLAAPPKVFNIGTFRYDKEYNRLIITGDLIGETIVIEYISTGINKNGPTYVPVQAEEALIAWVHRERAYNDPAITINERMMREARFKATMADLHSFETSFSYDQLLDVIRAGHTQLPKR